MTSRPARNQPVPAPSALDSYCADCGRVMPAGGNDPKTPRKYCSASCRTRAKDKSRIPTRSAIVHAYHQLLDGSYLAPLPAGGGKPTDALRVRAKAKGLETERARQKAKASAKGGAIVLCSEAERAAVLLSAEAAEAEEAIVTESESGEGVLIGEAEESDEEGQRQRELSRAAAALQEASDLREEARRAARRLVNFGWRCQGLDEERGVEAVQGGKVVESSYAKGEWGIRWAERR